MISTSIFLSILLWVVPQALAAAHFGCHQHPYDKMQEFRHIDKARHYCHAHWPEPTTRKTVYPTCLRSTSTIAKGTTTVTATKTQRCSTTETSPPPSSVYPVPYENTDKPKRDAMPAPTSGPLAAPEMSKREASPFPEPEEGETWGELEKRRQRGWDNHRRMLNECGYECVQRACSCMARTKTIYVSIPSLIGIGRS